MSWKSRHHGTSNSRRPSESPGLVKSQVIVSSGSGGSSSSCLPSCLASSARGPARPVSAISRLPTTAPWSEDRKRMPSSAFQERNAPSIATRYLSPPPSASLLEQLPAQVLHQAEGQKAHRGPNRRIPERLHPPGRREPTPTTMPGTVIYRGRIQCSRSMKVSGISSVTSTSADTSSQVKSKRRTHARKSNPVSQLHQRVADGDGRLAPAASAAQRQPREERDVLVPGQRVPALGAPGAGPDDALLVRHTSNDDIQETADAQAQNEKPASQQRTQKRR